MILSMNNSQNELLLKVGLRLPLSPLVDKFFVRTQVLHLDYLCVGV